MIKFSNGKAGTSSKEGTRAIFESNHRSVECNSALKRFSDATDRNESNSGQRYEKYILK